MDGEQNSRRSASKGSRTNIQSSKRRSPSRGSRTDKQSSKMRSTSKGTTNIRSSKRRSSSKGSKADKKVSMSDKPPKVISISAKCSDLFSMSVKDENNQPIASYSGYVPSFMPSEGGYGDYVQMEIDIATGRILNWKNPSGHSEFKAILEGRGEEYESD